jgi:hypothetical protein
MTKKRRLHNPLHRHSLCLGSTSKNTEGEGEVAITPSMYLIGQVLAMWPMQLCCSFYSPHRLQPHPKLRISLHWFFDDVLTAAWLSLQNSHFAYEHG